MSDPEPPRVGGPSSPGSPPGSPPGPPHGPGVRIPPPVMVAALVLAAWGIGQWAPLPLVAPQPRLGLVTLGIGIGLAAWTLATMVRAGTDPRPDKPDRTLLRGGPFRFTRNPIYLGFLLIAAGLALRRGDAWAWVALAGSWLALDRLVVAREEAYLRGRFGAAYEAYQRQVRRWV